MRQVLRLAWAASLGTGELRPGPMVQVFRLGPLYDRYSGELIEDITDELLADIVRVFNARAPVKAIPIDWSHGSAPDQSVTPEIGNSLGHVAELVHVPGKGLWAVPAYTERGAAVVEAAEGVLFTSPEFVVGEVFDQTTGDELGEAELLALALTNRPRQDRLEPVRLSETAAAPKMVMTQRPVTRAEESPMEEMQKLCQACIAACRACIAACDKSVPEGQACVEACEECIGACEACMQGNAEPGSEQAMACARACQACVEACEAYQKTGKAPAECEACMSACKECAAACARQEMEDMSQTIAAENAALKEEVVQLRKANDDLRAKLGTQETAAGKYHDVAGKMARLTEQMAALEKRATQAEASAAKAERDRLLDGYENRGLFVRARRQYMERLYGQAPALFAEEIQRLEASPEVPVEEIGHGMQGPDANTHPAAKLDAEITKYAETHKVDYLAAYKAVKRAKPDLFEEVT